MRFESVNDIDKNIVLAYIKEAIKNQKLGKEIKPDRRKKETVIPEELKAILVNDLKGVLKIYRLTNNVNTANILVLQNEKPLNKPV